MLTPLLLSAVKKVRTISVSFKAEENDIDKLSLKEQIPNLRCVELSI